LRFRGGRLNCDRRRSHGLVVPTTKTVAPSFRALRERVGYHKSHPLTLHPPRSEGAPSFRALRERVGYHQSQPISGHPERVTQGVKSRRTCISKTPCHPERSEGSAVAFHLPQNGLPHPSAYFAKGWHTTNLNPPLGHPERVTQGVTSRRTCISKTPCHPERSEGSAVAFHLPQNGVQYVSTLRPGIAPTEGAAAFRLLNSPRISIAFRHGPFCPGPPRCKGAIAQISSHHLLPAPPLFSDCTPA
jgi:hypothetical protein